MFRAYKLWYLCLLGAVLCSVPARAEFGRNLFGRNSRSLFSLRQLVGNNFDLTFGFPQDEPGFSRLAALRNQNAADAARRVFIKGGNGLVQLEARLRDDGLFEVRRVDAFGRPYSNFVVANLDSEADRQAKKFFLESNKLGDFNNLAKILNGQVNLRDVIAANLLAVRTLGPELTAGVLRIQCRPDTPDKQPTDFLATQMNNQDRVDPSYKNLPWQKRCTAPLLQALNAMVDATHPPIMPGQLKLDEKTGLVTVTGLRRNFSLRNLAIAFGKPDNMDLCFSDREPQNQIWSYENIFRQRYNPDIYNRIQGLDPDDANRNLFLLAGVNLALPTALQGRIGAKLTDHYFVNTTQSGVAKAQNGTREVLAWEGNGYKVHCTRDVNAYQSGVKLAAQNARQTGGNNQADRQLECLYYDRFGRVHGALMADKNDGKFTLATEAPATAAFDAHNGVVSANCDECHAGGPGIYNHRGGPYDPVNLAGTSGVQNLSANFSKSFAGQTGSQLAFGAFIGDANRPNENKASAFDVFQKINQPRNLDRVSTDLGYAPTALATLLSEQPGLVKTGRIEMGPGGTIDPSALQSGGACFLKKALARRFGNSRGFGAGAGTEQLASRGTPASGRASGDTHTF